MARPAEQRPRGLLRLGAVLLAAAALLALCHLARADAASTAGPQWNSDGLAVVAEDNAAGQEVAPSKRTLAEEEAATVPERVEIEINDYGVGPNMKHSNYGPQPHP